MCRMSNTNHPTIIIIIFATADAVVMPHPTHTNTHTHMDLTLDFHSIYVCRVIFFLPIKSYLMYFSTMKKKHVKTYICVCVMFSRILFSLSTVNIYSVQSFGWPKHVNNNKIKIKIGKKYETYIQNIVNHVVIAAGYTEK